MVEVRFIIHGEASSKSNSPMLTRRKGKAAVGLVSSKGAQRFKRDCARCIPILKEPWTCDVKVTATLFYGSRHKDLDPSLVYDCMQKKVIMNDRQIKEQHTYWRLDKQHPRCEVVVEPIAGPLFEEQAA